MKKSGSENVEVKRFVGLDSNGYEHPDPTPVEVPTRLRIPQRQVDRIRDIIRRELSVAAQSEGWESFDEADDFEVEGEDPISPYEEVFEPPSSAAEQPEPKAAPGSAPGAVDKGGPKAEPKKREHAKKTKESKADDPEGNGPADEGGPSEA